MSHHRIIPSTSPFTQPTARHENSHPNQSRIVNEIGVELYLLFPISRLPFVLRLFYRSSVLFHLDATELRRFKTEGRVAVSTSCLDLPSRRMVFLY